MLYRSRYVKSGKICPYKIKKNVLDKRRPINNPEKSALHLFG